MFPNASFLTRNERSFTPYHRELRRNRDVSIVCLECVHSLSGAFTGGECKYDGVASTTDESFTSSPVALSILGNCIMVGK